MRVAKRTLALHFLSHVLRLVSFFPAYGLTGLARGGQQLTRCKEVFGKVVKLLVELASLQVSGKVGEDLTVQGDGK